MRRKRKDYSEEYTSQIGLHILFSAISFLNLIASCFVAGILIVILKKVGLIETLDDLLGAKTANTTLFVVTSFVLGGIISFLVSKMPLKPFRNIVNAHNNLAKGRFDTRLKFGRILSRNKSMTELENSFNKMAEELGNTELLRTDFINNFSHEFKTPIVSIAGFATLLKNGDLSDEQKTEYLEIIEEESLRLSKMATNVLNLTKIENQTILTDKTEFNLTEQVRNCLLLFENKWNEKKLEVDFQGDEILINASEELLKQVWINLIDNAVKYSNDYGEVKINIVKREKQIVVSVINTGDIIPKESLNKIFSKFYQVDVSHSGNGNGIGLAIVKKIVELHKGRIDVESIDNLTEFNVNLPC